MLMGPKVIMRILRPSTASMCDHAYITCPMKSMTVQVPYDLQETVRKLAASENNCHGKKTKRKIIIRSKF